MSATFKDQENIMAQSSDDDEENPENLLNKLMGELQMMTEGLDSVPSPKEVEIDMLKPLCTEISTPRIDSYRFSMANLEDSQEVDLDAILTELSDLEKKYVDIKRNSFPLNAQTNNKAPQSDAVNQSNPIQHLSNNLNPSAVLPQRTDSPDNDSAFSDTVSMLSSESSTSSGASTANKPSGLPLYHTKDAAFMAKQEKIRLALEKMKKASIKKLFIKAFTIDGSSKSLLVDEKMTCGYVTRLLADKNHVLMDPKWALVEHLTDLHMERIFEDHEILVDNLMLWARDSKNKIYFVERPEKVALFHNPEKYLIGDYNKNNHNEQDEHSRGVLIEEFFNQTPSADGQTPADILTDGTTFANNPTPHVEGPLFIKSDVKKGWKKYHCVIKPTGLYYYPKDKSKTKEMVCLGSFGVNEVYSGINWRKKYKAPTNFCFALKHPRLQQPKCVKYIKFLCAEDRETFERWTTALRIVKHGKPLLDNYRALTDDMAQDDLDQLAHARSCSVMSITHNNIGPLRHFPVESPVSDNQTKIYSEGSITSSDISSGRLSSCTSSSSSSGCMSDSAPSGNDGSAFDSEYSTGTIKRKPSMKPNIPLTNMTRQLKEMADSVSCSSYSSIGSSIDHLSTSAAYTNTGTLTRRTNRRKSIQSNNTDDSSGSGTLKKHKLITNRGSVESMTSSHSSNSGSITPLQSISLRDILYNAVNGKQSLTNLKSPFANNVHHFQDSDLKLDILPSQDESIVDSKEKSDTEILIDDLSEEAIQNLPLPPPPSSFNKINYDPMFCSTLSLESLPPPPPEEQSLECCNLSDSQLSLSNLPPPPSLTDLLSQFDINDVDVTDDPCRSLKFNAQDDLQVNMSFNQSKDNDKYSVPSLRKAVDVGYRQILQKPKIISNQNSIIENAYLQYQNVNDIKSEYDRASSPIILRKKQNEIETSITDNIKSPTIRKKQVSFTDMPQTIPDEDCTQYVNMMNLKPLPPKRNENTRLSLPKKLTDSTSNPPKNFILDLQRVMNKKWQVAQKCKLEPTTTPHEVLGFREYPYPVLTNDYKETNVSNWVQEHYGRPSPKLYENMISNVENDYSVASYTCNRPLTGVTPPQVEYDEIVKCKKRPPPPIPKRSESTQLTVSVQKMH